MQLGKFKALQHLESSVGVGSYAQPDRATLRNGVRSQIREGQRSARTLPELVLLLRVTLSGCTFPYLVSTRMPAVEDME